MVAHYYIAYNENMKSLALKVKDTKTVTVRSAHQKAHQEAVNENTMFHLFGGEVLSLAQFIEKYGN